MWTKQWKWSICPLSSIMYRNVSDGDSKFTRNKYYSLRRSPPSNESSSVPKSNNNNLSESVGNFFKKKFHFRKQLHWKLPPINQIFDERQHNQTVPELLWIKSVLNHVKDQLNDYPLDTWSKFTAKRDPSSSIAWYLRSEVKAEFVTKAWCKFYECLGAFPIVKISPQGEFNSVRSSGRSNVATRYANILWPSICFSGASVRSTRRIHCSVKSLP